MCKEEIICYFSWKWVGATQRTCKKMYVSAWGRVQRGPCQIVQTVLYVFWSVLTFLQLQTVMCSALQCMVEGVAMASDIVNLAWLYCLSCQSVKGLNPPCNISLLAVCLLFNNFSVVPCLYHTGLNPSLHKPIEKAIVRSLLTEGKWHNLQQQQTAAN